MSTCTFQILTALSAPRAPVASKGPRSRTQVIWDHYYGDQDDDYYGGQDNAYYGDQDDEDNYYYGGQNGEDNYYYGGQDNEDNYILSW